MQEIQQGDLQLPEMRGTLTALSTKDRGWVRAGPSCWTQRISTRCNTSTGIGRRGKPSSSDGEPTSSLQDRKYRELLDKIDDPTKDVRNGDLDLENQELSMHLYFALVLDESVGELIVRNVNQGEGAVAWRQILGEYASTEPGNVLATWSKPGDLRFPQGPHTVVGINQMEEDMTKYQKMAGEKSVRHHQERHPHEGPYKRSRSNVFRNSTRLSTYEKMREKVMSALTAERAVHEPMGDDSMEIGAVGKSGKKGTGKKGKGKNEPEGSGKGPRLRKRLRDPEPHCRSRVRATLKRNAEFVWPTRGTARIRTRKTRERTNGSGKRRRNE